jgi:hypothetical protein
VVLPQQNGTERNETKRRHVSAATSFCPKPVWVTKLGSFIAAGIELITSDIATATPPRAARKALTADKSADADAHTLVKRVAATRQTRGGHVAKRTRGGEICVQSTARESPAFATVSVWPRTTATTAVHLHPPHQPATHARHTRHP